MRLIRLLLICLTLATALAALFVAAAFVPAVQTWIVEQALARHPGLQASVGSVSARFHSVRVSDLCLQHDRAILTLPALEVRLPLKAALWDRKVLVQSLVAKGWTLDLSRQTAGGQEEVRGSGVASRAGEGKPAALAEAAPGPQVGRLFRGLLSGWELPCDASLDGVELEGDVLFAAPSGKEPIRVRVTVKGGGMASGHGGDFALEAAGSEGNSWRPAKAAAVRGRIGVTMESPRTFNRIEFKGNLASVSGPLPEALALSAGVAAADRTHAEIYTLNLSHGSRDLATVTASFPQETRRFEGTWKIDLRDSDLARFHPDRSLPTLATAGEGNFDTDPTFTRVHATGRLRAAVSRLGFLAPVLDRLGAVTLEAGFDLAHGAQAIRVDRLSVSVAGIRPIAVAQSLQPFSVDERTGDLKVADPGTDWLEGSLQGLPIAWLSGLGPGLAFAGGEVKGDFAVKAADGGFALRSKSPLLATGVSVQRAGQGLGPELDLSLALIAEHTPRGWQVQGAPLTIDSGRRCLATIEAKVSPLAGASRRLAIAGNWRADLDALASQPAIPGTSLLKGRSASGEFSASVGTTLEVKGKVSMSGHDPGHTLTARVNAYVDAYGGVSFRVPVAIAQGASTSEFTAEGTWTKTSAGPRVKVELSAVHLALEHLLPLVASWSAAGGVSLPAILHAGTDGPPFAAGRRDQQPFWGDWTGRVRIDFYRVRSGALELHEVAGTFDFDHGAIRLEHGRGVLTLQSPAVADLARRSVKAEPSRSVVTAEGSIAFDAAAEFPYSGKATAAVDVVDAARLLNAAQVAREAVVEGRFAVVETLTGNGINLVDLVGRRREEFRLTSKGGIVRLLKANVAEAIPETPTPVSDALANVGSVFGSLLGIKRDPVSTGMNRLSKATEAVLNFTYQTPEIRYDQLTVTAIRGNDRTIHLAEIAMNAPNERLTGSGQITYIEGLPLRAQPIVLELRFGARGRTAALLSTAGVLSSDQDDQGYTLLPLPIHFGGSLEQIDNSEWRDVLVKAATQKPDRRKKGG